MANRIGFTDTLTGKETVCGTWAKTTLAVIQLSVSHNDWARFLPFCNGWNLDYPQKDECPIGCTVRVGWRIGTILFRIGLYHLIIWEKKEPTF